LTMPQGDGRPRPIGKRDLETILTRIDEIVEELRELRRAPVLPRTPPRLEEAELNSIQERALQVLAEEGEMTSMEVAKALNRTRPLMVINLNQLVALGFVEKVRRGRHVYFRRRPPETARIIGRELEGGCYLFVALVSDNWPENVEDMERLISEYLKSLPGWRIEHVAVLPRPLAEDSSGR